MKLFLSILSFLFLINFSYSQQITFEKYYDFGATESGNCVQQTPDGGYVITGNYNSAITGSHLLIMKTDSVGTLLWERTYGGLYIDAGMLVQNTFDGGFIVAGFKDDISTSNSKIWLLKMDVNGDTTWTKTITAGLGANHANFVQQTTDSGYFIAGYTSARGAGAYDVFIIKTNSIGDTLWTRTFGGSGSDGAYSAQQTTDGGYIVAGGTASFGMGMGDMYLIKTDSLGDSLWTKTYGGTRPDNCYSVQQTLDGGYILAGLTESFLDTIFSDAYMVKTNSNGDTIWTHFYGGASDGESFTSVQQTSDSGFIVLGDAPDPTLTNGNLWILKINSIGDTLWTKSYGGNGNEMGYYINKTNDNGFIAVGQTNSFTPLSNSDDIYLVKMDSTGYTIIGVPELHNNSEALYIFPNPFNVSATLILPETFNSKNTELIVYNIFGQELFRAEVKSNQIKLERGNLTNVIYFIQVINSKGNIATGKFVLE